MLKDADYSTPADHYFGHIARLKGGDAEKRVELETEVLDGLAVDHGILKVLIEENAPKERTLTEEFDSLSAEEQKALAVRHNYNPSDLNRLRLMF